MTTGARIAGTALAVTLAVVGCSEDGAAPEREDILDGVDPTVPVSPGELPTPGPFDPDELAGPGEPLGLGDIYAKDATSIAVLDLRRPLSGPGAVPRPPRGQEWVGVDARTCFDSEEERQLEVGSYLFSVLSADNRRYPGIQPQGPDWPLPQYPGYGRISPGQCTRGWVAIPVPVRETIDVVVAFAGRDLPVAAWSVPPAVR